MDMAAESLTALVKDFLAKKGQCTTSEKTWSFHQGTKTTKSYWWNYFLIEGDWHGFEVYPDNTVKMVV